MDCMVQQASRPVSGDDQNREGCRHHWIIEAPTGPMSNGVCQLCAEVREFKNYIEAAPWGEDPLANKSGGQYTAPASSNDVPDSEEP